MKQEKCKYEGCPEFFWTRNPERRLCAHHGGLQGRVKRSPRFKRVKHSKPVVVAEPKDKKRKKKH